MATSDTDIKIKIIKLIDSCESENDTAAMIAQRALQELMSEIGGDKYDALLDEISGVLSGLGKISLDRAIAAIKAAG